MSPYSLDTAAVRSALPRSQYNEHSEALFLTSSFVFDSAEQAEERFAQREGGFVYSRFSNPTVASFERRLAEMEGAEACLGTASGMAAILLTALGLLAAGDHVICAAGVFGATRQLFENTLSRFGLRISFVPVTDVSAWQAAVTPSTKMLFVESPTNPTIVIADLAALGAIARACGAYMVVDNCFCTPVLQRPFQFGADVVIHSATKYLDGQGRVLGGAILARQELIEQKILPVQRSAGAALSPFNAWVLLKGLETLKLRVEAQCDNALRLARWLKKHPAIARVIYPGLTSHPQHDLARRQQSGAGAILAVEVRGAKAEAFRVINSTRLLSITANVGDVKTTITHPATTTHARISSEARREAGIGDAMLRIAVGLESIDDLCADLERGLSQLAVDRRAA